MAINHKTVSSNGQDSDLILDYDEALTSTLSLPFEELPSYVLSYDDPSSLLVNCSDDCLICCYLCDPHRPTKADRRYSHLPRPFYVLGLALAYPPNGVPVSSGIYILYYMSPLHPNNLYLSFSCDDQNRIFVGIHYSLTHKSFYHNVHIHKVLNQVIHNSLYLVSQWDRSGHFFYIFLTGDEF